MHNNVQHVKNNVDVLYFSVLIPMTCVRLLGTMGEWREEEGEEWRGGGKEWKGGEIVCLRVCVCVCGGGGRGGLS